MSGLRVLFSHLVLLVFILCFLFFSGPAQPGLTAQQCVLHVHCLLGKHGSSWHHPSSRLNCPFGAEGQAHLHPNDPCGWIQRYESAAVERRLCQLASREALSLVPRPDQDLHQRSDATASQPELCGERQRRQSGRVGELWSKVPGGRHGYVSYIQSQRKETLLGPLIPMRRCKYPFNFYEIQNPFYKNGLKPQKTFSKLNNFYKILRFYLWVCNLANATFESIRDYNFKEK